MRNTAQRSGWLVAVMVAVAMVMGCGARATAPAVQVAMDLQQAGCAEPVTPATAVQNVAAVAYAFA